MLVFRLADLIAFRASLLQRPRLPCGANACVAAAANVAVAVASVGVMESPGGFV